MIIKREKVKINKLMNDNYGVYNGEFFKFPLSKTMAFNKKDIYIETDLILREGTLIELSQEYDGGSTVYVYFCDLNFDDKEVLLKVTDVAMRGTMLFTWYFSCLKKRALEYENPEKQIRLFIPDIDEKIPKYPFKKLGKWYKYAKEAEFFNPQLLGHKINYQILESGWWEYDYEYDYEYDFIKHKYL